MSVTLAVALLSIALSVAAQFMLKTGMSQASLNGPLSELSVGRAAWVVFSNPYIVGGFALYGVGAVVWLSVLAKLDVSKAYPLVGFGFVLTAIVGALLGEQVGLQRSLGILLICAGVALVGRS